MVCRIDSLAKRIGNHRQNSTRFAGAAHHQRLSRDKAKTLIPGTCFLEDPLDAPNLNDIKRIIANRMIALQIESRNAFL